MGTALPTGIVLPVSNDNVAMQSYADNMQTINDKLVEDENNLASHMADNTKHITSVERSAWNAKANQSDFNSHLAEKAKYQTATGSNTIAITTGGDFSLTQGNWVKWIQASANTGAVTINVDSKGAKALKNSDKGALVAGDLEAGKGYEAYYSLSDDFFVLPPRGAKLTEIINAIVSKGGTVASPQKITEIVSAINSVATWDTDIIAENILTGKNIFGVAGNVQPKQVANGTVNVNAGSILYQTISGLAFTPDFVIVSAKTTNYDVITGFLVFSNPAKFHFKLSGSYYLEDGFGGGAASPGGIDLRLQGQISGTSIIANFDNIMMNTYNWMYDWWAFKL